MRIFDIIDKKLVMFLETAEMKDTVKAMIDEVYKAGKISDRNEFEKAIIAREEIVSTGIGLGVAIPHAKLPTIDNFFIAIATIKDGIDWDSIDHKPVRAVFLIGGPDKQQGEYLKILAKLTLLIKNAERREKLFAATTPEEIIEVFDKF
jgi:PTS system nitrogen regulatory IIA component